MTCPLQLQTRPFLVTLLSSFEKCQLPTQPFIGPLLQPAFVAQSFAWFWTPESRAFLLICPTYVVTLTRCALQSTTKRIPLPGLHQQFLTGFVLSLALRIKIVTVSASVFVDRKPRSGPLKLRQHYSHVSVIKVVHIEVLSPLEVKHLQRGTWNGFHLDNRCNGHQLVVDIPWCHIQTRAQHRVQTRSIHKEALLQQ